MNGAPSNNRPWYHGRIPWYLVYYHGRKYHGTFYVVLPWYFLTRASCIKGPTSKGRGEKGKEGERREWEGRGDEGREWKRKGKGRSCPGPRAC